MYKSTFSILLTFLFCVSATLTAQKSDGSIVRVEANGPSPFEARQEAIRQALQMTMKQLVVADRAIDNDTIIRDRVISTMNGYVKHFSIISSERRDGQVFLVADVTVSPTAITQFIESSNLNGVSKTSSDNLIANAARESEARRNRSEMLVSSLSQFPASAMSSQIVKMAPNEVDPNLIDVWVQVQYDKGFVTAVKQQMSAMAQGVPKPRSIDAATPNLVLICFSADAPDSVDAPTVLARKHFASALNTCSPLPNIDPSALGLLASGAERKSQSPYSSGLVSLATGFGSEQEIPSMNVIHPNQMEAYVVNRNRGVDKFMRGLSIANRVSAGLNGREADTSAEDPSLFCTQQTVMSKAPDQCRLKGQDGNLMMVALQPDENSRSLWIWMDTRPRLFHYSIPVSAVKPGMSRYVGMPFLTKEKRTLRSLFPTEGAQLSEGAENLKLLEADFKLYALRNDSLDSAPAQSADDNKKKKKDKKNK